jgi:MFS family permease
MPSARSASVTGSRAAFAYSAFKLLQAARFFVVLALEMQSVAVGWQVYDITRRPVDLGYVGLIQFLPGVLLFLVSGHVADRLNRRDLLGVCFCGFASASAALLFIALHPSPSVSSIYAVLLFLGVVRSFNGPASRALLPQLVPIEVFPNAVAWASSFFQTATILGPALGGVLYAVYRGPALVYAVAALAGCIAAVLTFRMARPPSAHTRQPSTADTLFAGFRYIWREKLILGAISLDLFAVLLGGAVALLPVYAREILRTGPWGLGVLRSTPGVGAAVMAVLLAHRPLRRRAGAVMLWCVAGFGAFTVVFGLSRSMALSLIALCLVGAADMVSVVVRGTLIQINTPNEMRGRVNAVDMVFIGASNEFGQFESGITAQWFGAVPAVVLGGIGAIVVTALWAWRFPELRKAQRLAPELAIEPALGRTPSD